MVGEQLTKTQIHKPLYTHLIRLLTFLRNVLAIIGNDPTLSGLSNYIPPHNVTLVII